MIYRVRNVACYGAVVASLREFFGDERAEPGREYCKVAGLSGTLQQSTDDIYKCTGDLDCSAIP